MDFSFSYKKTPQGSGAAPQPKTGVGEAQYNQLRGCGIAVKPPKGWWDVQRGHDPETYSTRPYVRVLELMGAMNPDGEPWSDDVWFYKTPAALDENEITTIITNVKRLMKDAFPLGDPMVMANADTGGFTVTIEVNCTEETWDIAGGEGTFDSVLEKLGAAARGAGEGRVATCPAFKGTLVIFLNDTEIGELTNDTRTNWTVRG